MIKRLLLLTLGDQAQPQPGNSLGHSVCVADDTDGTQL
jgi:hypothetical protein